MSWLSFSTHQREHRTIVTHRCNASMQQQLMDLLPFIIYGYICSYRLIGPKNVMFMRYQRYLYIMLVVVEGTVYIISYWDYPTVDTLHYYMLFDLIYVVLRYVCSLLGMSRNCKYLNWELKLPRNWRFRNWNCLRQVRFQFPIFGNCLRQFRFQFPIIRELLPAGYLLTALFI